MVNIQWYPGHMEKARRDMQDSLKAVDMIIEVRDARIPLASANPMLDQMAKDKPRLIVLSKADLADPDETEKWIKRLSGDNAMVLALDMQHDKSARKQVIDAAGKLTEARRNRMIARGIRPRAMRAMACGIPNSGKSTLINRIAGKNTAKTADKPGVTRSLTWIHADKTLDLLDTPGVLWPKFDDQKTGQYLAVTGAINEDILNLKEIAVFAADTVRSHYPQTLKDEYGIEEDTPSEKYLDMIAQKRRLLKENGIPDEERAAVVFLHELRRGALGRITLERCDEEAEDLQQ